MTQIVFVAEKPSQAKLLAPHIQRRWPDAKLYIVLTLYIGPYEFSYPRGLKMADYPYIAEPTWKPRRYLGVPHDFNVNSLVMQIEGGELHSTVLAPGDVLRESDDIWYACDADHSGAHAYYVLLSQTLGHECAAAERPMLMLSALDEASLVRVFDTCSTTSCEAFQEWLRHGLAKRYFEYNFNVNALALLAPCLRSVGVDTDTYWLSKYSLQLLYAMRDQPSTKENSLLRTMEKWPGTGRYAPTEMGSPASRYAMIEGLTRVGLLESNSGELFLSERGAACLSILHPDCNDQDLPSRLTKWQDNWPSSRPQIDRYLRTVFGKQKRFGARVY